MGGWEWEESKNSQFSFVVECESCVEFDFRCISTLLDFLSTINSLGVGNDESFQLIHWELGMRRVEKFSINFFFAIGKK